MSKKKNNEYNKKITSNSFQEYFNKSIYEYLKNSFKLNTDELDSFENIPVNTKELFDELETYFKESMEGSSLNKSEQLKRLEDNLKGSIKGNSLNEGESFKKLEASLKGLIEDNSLDERELLKKIENIEQKVNEIESRYIENVVLKLRNQIKLLGNQIETEQKKTDDLHDKIKSQENHTIQVLSVFSAFIGFLVSGITIFKNCNTFVSSVLMLITLSVCLLVWCVVIRIVLRSDNLKLSLRSGYFWGPLLALLLIVLLGVLYESRFSSKSLIVISKERVINDIDSIVKTSKVDSILIDRCYHVHDSVLKKSIKDVIKYKSIKNRYTNIGEDVVFVYPSDSKKRMN